MVDARTKLISFEDIAVGDKRSRLSSAIFFLLCFIPVFSTVLFGGVDSMTWVLLTVIWAAVVLLWLIEAWRARGLVFDLSAIQLPLIALLVVGLVQLLPLGPELPTGLLSVPASRAFSLDPYATRLFLARLVIFIVYLAACLTFVNSEKRLKKVVLLVIIFGSVMAFEGILQRLADPDMIYGLRKPFQANPFGPFVNQHHFAAFMEMAGGVTLGLLLGSLPRDKKALLAIALVVMVSALILTSSRGGMLSFGATTAFAGLLSFLYRARHNRRGEASDEPKSVSQKVAVAVGALSLVLVVVGLVLFLGGDESLLRGIGLGDTAADVSNGRLHFWSVAIRVFLDHPILGAGLDAFGLAFPKYDTWNGTFRVEQAHNDYLQTLADSGLLGFACLAAFIFLLFKKGLRTIAASKPGFRREAAIGALAGCFGILIHSFFDFPLRTWSNSFFFLLLAAVAIVAIKPEGHSAESSKRRRRSSSSSSRSET